MVVSTVMKAFENATAELWQLKELHNTTCYSFAQTEAVLAWKAKRSAHTIKTETGLDILSPIAYRVKRGHMVRAQLRELFFIRLVSVLETYLVDSVRDVFSISKEPFKEQVQLQLTQAELLSAGSIAYVFSKIINKETRALTSGGYVEIIKYYRKRFGLDLCAVAPGKAVMEEYHERRHLFVHRLGRPDSRYRKAYQFSGNQLTVTEGYLLECFTNFQKYIDGINQHFKDWLPSIGTPSKGISTASLTYRVSFPTTKPNNPGIVQEGFTFWAGDELYSLGDIVSQKKYVNERECELTVTGDTFILAAYDKLIRKAERNLDLVASRHRAYGLTQVRKVVPADILEKVQTTLPPQPWPTGVHKQVAKALGYTNRIVSDSIQVLITRGVFKHQVDGQIIT